MIELNDQQEAAITAMVAFIDSNESTFTLKGFAGTGKSTTIQFLIEKMGSSGIVFTAPTHKAIKVLKRMAGSKGLSVPCCTIHSLLGLRIKQVGDKQILEPQKHGKNKQLKDVKIIVVDECSMVGEELFRHILLSIKEHDIKYIFMGDPAQLPPVGENESQTFEATEHRATLTKIMRQRGENPVLGVCTDIREAFARGDSRLPVLMPGMADDGSVGVSIMTGALFTEWMPFAFSHDNFDHNPDRFRVIAWRNDTVDRINEIIHAIRYPDCQAWLAAGEPIAFTKPLMNAALVECESGKNGDEIIIQTDFEGIVISCEPSINKEIACHKVVALAEDGKAYAFYAVDNKGKQIRLAKMQAIANENRSMPKEKQQWWPYYELQQSFAEIRPAYCLTAHKSQGSTFENVFVDVIDVWANPNKNEALQCLYVACSRASHHLIVNASGG